MSSWSGARSMGVTSSPMGASLPPEATGSSQGSPGPSKWPHRLTSPPVSAPQHQSHKPLGLRGELRSLGCTHSPCHVPSPFAHRRGRPRLQWSVLDVSGSVTPSPPLFSCVQPLPVCSCKHPRGHSGESGPWASPGVGPQPRGGYC